MPEFDGHAEHGEADEVIGEPKLTSTVDDFDSEHPKLVQDPEEAFDMATAGYETRDRAFRSQKMAEYRKELIALYEEAQPRFGGLRSPDSRTREDWDAYEASRNRIVDEVLEQERALREKYFPDREYTAEADEELRNDVAKGLEKHGDGYWRSRGLDELGQQMRESKGDAARHEKDADYMEDMAQLVHRHPEAKDLDGRPFTLKTLIHYQEVLAKTNEAADWYKDWAEHIGGPEFDVRETQEALRAIRDRMRSEVIPPRWDDDELKAEFDRINELFKDDSTTLGTIKEKVARLFSESANSHETLAEQLTTALVPFVEEKKAIDEQRRHKAQPD
jgi:hypothetical protein